MKKIIFYLSSIIILSAHTLPNNSNPELDGIWVHQEADTGKSKTYLVVDGDYIQLYMEAYWAAGYNQYFSGDKLIANGSLIIHVENYLTISKNTGQAIKYRNCQKYQLQRLILHDVNEEQVKLEIIPGTSIYDSCGFFQDKIMKFKKLSQEEFKSVDPIFYKMPEILASNSTLIKDCASFSNK